MYPEIHNLLSEIHKIFPETHKMFIEIHKTFGEKYKKFREMHKISRKTRKLNHMKYAKCFQNYAKCFLKYTKHFQLRSQTCENFSLTPLCSSGTVLVWQGTAEPREWLRIDSKQVGRWYCISISVWTVTLRLCVHE